MNIIDKYFDKNHFIKNNILKVLHIKYGTKCLNTVLNIKKQEFKDFYNPHLTQPFLKSTFETVWSKEYSKIDEACYNKFRANNDLGTALCRYWHLLEGNFTPTKIIGKYFSMSNDNTKLIKVIKQRKHKIICINDSDNSVDFEKAKTEINNAFNEILSDKSEFKI